MQDTNSKPTIKIEWLSDSNECDQCGGGWSDGARVYLNNEVFLELIPHASCFGGDHYSEIDVFSRVLEKLGYEVEANY